MKNRTFLWCYKSDLYNVSLLARLRLSLLFCCFGTAFRQPDRCRLLPQLSAGLAGAAWFCPFIIDYMRSAFS